MDFEKIVDIHCHILPGLDDGPKDLEQSLSLAREAVKDGVTHILATPHHLDKQYVNHAKQVNEVTEKLQVALDQAQIPLTVFASQEVHINGDLDQRYADLLGVDEDKHYMLIEFPHGSVPAYAKQLFFKLKSLGTTPIIVHPERNSDFQKDLSLLYDFIANGALAQVTATSYLGGFGEQVAEVSYQMVKNNLVQVLGSDAHAMKGRGILMHEALDQIAKDFGEQKAILFEQTAEDLLNGERVVAKGYTLPTKKKKFWLF